MSVPAGWYDDGSGRQRWWDGEQWTEHFAPEADAQTPAASAENTADTAVASAEADLDATMRREDVPELNADAAETAAAPEAAASPEIPAAETPAAEVPAATDAPAAPGYAAPAASAQTAPEYAAPAAPGYPAPGYPAPGAPAYGDPNATAAYPTAPAYPGGAQPYGAPAYAAAPAGPAGPKTLGVLGLVGLGLAVLGTILACIPFTFVFGAIVLFAAFVVSLIAIFRKNTKKWPSITGLVLSVVGGIVGSVIFAVFIFGIANEAIENLPSDFPSSASEEPTEETDGGTSSAGRPTAEEVEVGLREIVATVGDETFTDEQFSCYAQYFVDSDIPDDTLGVIASGEEALTDMDAAQEFTDKLTSGMSTCLM